MANQSARKTLSTILVYTNYNYYAIISHIQVRFSWRFPTAWMQHTVTWKTKFFAKPLELLKNDQKLVMLCFPSENHLLFFFRFPTIKKGDWGNLAQLWTKLQTCHDIALKAEELFHQCPLNPSKKEKKGKKSCHALELLCWYMGVLKMFTRVIVVVNQQSESNYKMN